MLTIHLKADSAFLNIEVLFTSRNSHILQQSVYKLQKGICPYSYRIFKFNKFEKLTLVKVENQLRISNSYWETKFYPIKGRKISFLDML